MKERILEFLRTENKSSSQFAIEIGVQPSGISHILSGRNNPSLDFVLKMLEKYNYLSTDWLLFGKGPMYREHHDETLFDGIGQGVSAAATLPGENEESTKPLETVTYSGASEKPSGHSDSGSSVIRIVWFFSDGSFQEYYRRKP